MSEFHVVEIQFEDEDCLIKALEELGYKPAIHNDDPVNLYGYQGDKRQQKAHIVIPRSQVGTASNDVGFERQGDGKYIMHVSAYDKGRWADQTKKIKQLYAKNRVTKFISQNAGTYSLSSKTTKKDGTISMRLRRL
ncbi:MAG: DUF1257 domain-containing protein [Atribacterota bacterium]